jgi:hypothetical protein
MRPATLLRIERLNELLAALEAGDMGYQQAAQLLQCSLSAARKYLCELADAGVIVPAPRRGAGSRSYRLRADPRGATAYINSLADPQAAAGVGREMPRSTYPFGCAAGRDPLVAALFGARP